MSSQPRKLLLTGSTGHLGHRIAQLADEWEITHTWHSKPSDPTLPGTAIQLDLCNRHHVRTIIARHRPAAIVHTACSNRSEAAIVPAARNLADAAAAHSARLVHVSTDMVLDGNHAPYADDAEPTPLQPYGKAKAAAESIIAARCPHAAIVRTSLIFGIAPLDHQTRWLAADTAAGRQVCLFTDELRCPTWVDTLALALLELAAGDYAGHINVASPDTLNRWDFGLKMLALLGMKPGANVRPALQADSGLIRPADLTLDVSHAQQLLRTPLLTVDEAIEHISRRRPIPRQVVD